MSFDAGRSNNPFATIPAAQQLSVKPLYESNPRERLTGTTPITSKFGNLSVPGEVLIPKYNGPVTMTGFGGERHQSGGSLMLMA